MKSSDLYHYDFWKAPKTDNNIMTDLQGPSVDKS